MGQCSHLLNQWRTRVSTPRSAYNLRLDVKVLKIDISWKYSLKIVVHGCQGSDPSPFGHGSSCFPTLPHHEVYLDTLYSMYIAPVMTKKMTYIWTESIERSEASLQVRYFLRFWVRMKNIRSPVHPSVVWFLVFCGDFFHFIHPGNKIHIWRQTNRGLGSACKNNFNVIKWYGLQN